MREVPEYISQLNLGSMPKIQPSFAGAEATQRASAQLSAIGEDMQQKAAKIDDLNLKTTMQENTHRIALESGADVGKLKTNLEGYKKGLIAGISDPAKLAEINNQFSTMTMPLIDSATLKYNKNLDDQEEFIERKSVAANNASFATLAPSINSNVPEIKKSGIDAAAQLFEQNAAIFSSKKQDGTFKYSPEQRWAGAVEGAKSYIGAFNPKQQLDIIDGPQPGFAANMSQILASEVDPNDPDKIHGDGSGTKAYRGINSGANEEEFKVIEELLALGKNEEARKYANGIYKTKYWDAIGGDKLPPAIQGIVMDAAVNQGVSFAKKLAEESAKGATPGNLIDMRRERYAKTKGTPQERVSWENRLARYEHLRIGEQLDVLDASAKETMRKALYTEIEANIKLQRDDPFVAAVKQGAASIPQVAATQVANGVDPYYVRVTGNEDAKTRVQRLNQSRGTDDVIAFAQAAQEEYGEFLPQHLRDLKKAGDMKPEFESALSLALKGNPNYKEHIDVLSTAGAVGQSVVSKTFKENGYNEKDLDGLIREEMLDWKKILINEGQDPDTSDLKSMVMTKMNRDLSGSMSSALEWALQPDTDNYQIAKLNDVQYRIPTAHVSGGKEVAYDVPALEDRVAQEYAKRLPKIEKINLERYKGQMYRAFIHLNDHIIPYLNERQDGLNFKTLDYEPILDETGQKLTIRFEDVIKNESTKEQVDRVRKQLWDMPYAERKKYREKEFGIKIPPEPGDPDYHKRN